MGLYGYGSMKPIFNQLFNLHLLHYEIHLAVVNAQDVNIILRHGLTLGNPYYQEEVTSNPGKADLISAAVGSIPPIPLLH